jgi:ring-1,2-phenylacetyl-CoA epoxidase subunit PaaD
MVDTTAELPVAEPGAAKADLTLTPETVRRWLDGVPDPEIPVLSVNDLGIVRDIEVSPQRVTVSIAPTYIGCPATEVIERMIDGELRRRGLTNVKIKRVLSPAWTTDWLSEDGRRKLEAYGIAPPAEASGKRGLLGPEPGIRCPRCEAIETERVSEFGSTPCKAAYRCKACFEPFEYFKCI